MNNRWRRVANLDELSYAYTASETGYSIMVFNSVFWVIVAFDNHTERRTPSFRKGAKHYATKNRKRNGKC